MTDEIKPPVLEFTGERFTPECVREIWLEHWHRYAFALPFVSGKRVLDAACGEGFGSALLARTAADVVGLDISAQAIRHARVRYGGSASNLRYEEADCTALALPDGSIDVVVSFETIEHLHAQEALVSGFSRVLAPGGVLILSSPDKRNYSDMQGFKNEFHVRELYREELLALLGRHFSHIHLFGQKLLFQSAIWRLDDDGAESRVELATTDEANRIEPGLHYEPLYFIAVCSMTPLNSLPALALFGDREESVYRHYYHEIRKNMSAGARIAELESEVDSLRELLRTEQSRKPIAD